MMIYTSQERATKALQRIIMLNAEQQRIYDAIHNRNMNWIQQHRLQEITREIALAQNERNRARCGAPPTPPNYDPFIHPQVEPKESAEKVLGEKGNRKTTEEEVVDMRRLYNEGLSATQVWHEFSHLKESTVRDILKNRTWHDPDYTPRTTKRAKNIRDVVKQRVNPAFVHNMQS